MHPAQNPTRPHARPSFPTLQPASISSTSTSTSTSTSSSGYTTHSSVSSLSSPLQTSSAPLPSPSSSHPQHQGFFGSLNQPQQGQQTQSPQQHQQQPPRQFLQRTSSYECPPNREGAGRTAAETDNYLNQYALLAEAAKRAQMAVVMRDIESMEL